MAKYFAFDDEFPENVLDVNQLQTVKKSQQESLSAEIQSEPKSEPTFESVPEPNFQEKKSSPISQEEKFSRIDQEYETITDLQGKIISAESLNSLIEQDFLKESSDSLEETLQKINGPKTWKFWLGWLLSSLAFLYFLLQILWVFQAAAQLPAMLKWPILAFSAILCLIVLVSGWRLAKLYFSLKANRQQYLRDSQGRAKLRDLQAGEEQKHKISMCRILAEFVENYPQKNFSKNSEIKLLTNSKEKNLRELQELHEKLTSFKYEENTEKWLELYLKFQGILDQSAETRINQIAKIVGIKTAISPNPLWDMLIVLYWSFQFTRELCQTYNLRVNAIDTGKMVLQMWFTTICAGELDRLEDFGESVTESAVSSLTSNQFTAWIFGKTAAKLAAGTANYFLFKRLGKKALQMIRPLAEEKK